MPEEACRVRRAVCVSECMHAYLHVLSLCHSNLVSVCACLNVGGGQSYATQVSPEICGPFGL